MPIHRSAATSRIVLCGQAFYQDIPKALSIRRFLLDDAGGFFDARGKGAEIRNGRQFAMAKDYLYIFWLLYRRV